jgi:hypothetical protein
MSQTTQMRTEIGYSIQGKELRLKFAFEKSQPVIKVYFDDEFIQDINILDVSDVAAWLTTAVAVMLQIVEQKALGESND